MKKKKRNFLLGFEIELLIHYRALFSFGKNENFI